MKLFHFCRASDLDSIAEKGLYPRCRLSRSCRWGKRSCG